MTRFTVDNMGRESTIEVRHEFPFPKDRVEIPDDLPPEATVDVVEDEPRHTVVTIEFPADADVELPEEWA
jgi:hypothetical protein